MSSDFIRTQNPIGGFLGDPFLELNGASTTSTVSKSTKSASSAPCVTDGALAEAIIGTLILSALIGFLLWLTYLRPKFQELHQRLLYSNRRSQRSPTLVSTNYKQSINDGFDHETPQLPLDVTDYKFGTFPFRQSHVSSVNSPHNRADWLHRISSSFRSVNIDQESEMIDIELLEPTFGGLNFSITGNMRAGIFVKDILDKGQMKSHPSNQLKSGDRIMALTVCFESIVYEDALTILSYASPYPVILRVKRPSNHVKVHLTSERRSTTVNPSSKVKWRDDFEQYDNDTLDSRSYVSPTRPPPPPATTTTNSKVPTSPQTRTSSKKTTSAPPRQTSKPSTTTKGNKIKPSSSSAATSKRLTTDRKKSRSKPTNQPMLASTGLTLKPPSRIPTPPISTNKKPVKSVTNAVISYLHYKGGNAIEPSTEIPNPSEGTVMPYYDSPYDYYYGGQTSQYQYLHQSHLNKNNNNSLSADTFTAITPNLANSVYTIQLSSRRSSLPIPRRYERRLSSPAIITTAPMMERTLGNGNENSITNIDTFV